MDGGGRRLYRALRALVRALAFVLREAGSHRRAFSRGVTGYDLHFKKIPLAAGLRTDHRGQERCKEIGNIDEFPQFLALTWTRDLTSLCLSFLICKVGITALPSQQD